MNELKPEDVMRALECCGTPKLTKCENCPRKDEDALCMYRLSQDAIALLREKDVEIERLYIDIRETVRVANEGMDKKNAEIERLTSNMNGYAFTAQTLSKEFEDYQADVQMEIADARAEAITEFAERLGKWFSHDPAFLGVERRLVLDVVDQIAKEMKGDQR